MPSQQKLPIKHCAICTRKNTTHRLEHEGNSLVTRREIGSAYVTRQHYKGWGEPTSYGCNTGRAWPGQQPGSLDLLPG